jgi:hypothetical protein
VKIVEAIALSAFRLKLKFDNGESGIVDLSSLVGRGVFAAWQQPGVFEQVAITDVGAVEWPSEIDLCPDALYLQMSCKSIDEVFPALRNRFSHA